MKKYFVFLIFILLTSCFSINLIKNEISDDYVKNNFDKYTRITFGLLDEQDYNVLLLTGKQNILNDQNLSKDQKEKAISQLKSLKYIKNKLFAFKVMSPQAFTEKEINFHFKLSTKNGKEINTNIQNILLKILGYGPLVHHWYYWIIETNAPIDKENFEESDFPMNFKIVYPDGKIQLYEIKL